MKEAEASVVIPSMDEAPAPVIKKTVSHATHTSKPVHHKAKKVPSSVASVKNRMVLRAASPDEAWIAKDQMTTDLQPVHVGDTVSGIGTVTAIRDDNGIWVVDGTHGSIR